MSYGRLREPVSSWPVPNEQFEPAQALQARDQCFAEYDLADQLGFDWVSLAEHHYSPGSLAPSINVLAAALSQRVHRARIAILGPLLPLGNPVRIAEEIAMVDKGLGPHLSCLDRHPTFRLGGKALSLPQRLGLAQADTTAHAADHYLRLEQGLGRICRA